MTVLLFASSEMWRCDRFSLFFLRNPGRFINADCFNSSTCWDYDSDLWSWLSRWFSADSLLMLRFRKQSTEMATQVTQQISSRTVVWTRASWYLILPSFHHILPCICLTLHLWAPLREALSLTVCSGPRQYPHPRIPRDEGFDARVAPNETDVCLAPPPKRRLFELEMTAAFES